MIVRENFEEPNGGKQNRVFFLPDFDYFILVIRKEETFFWKLLPTRQFPLFLTKVFFALSLTPLILWKLMRGSIVDRMLTSVRKPSFMAYWSGINLYIQ